MQPLAREGPESRGALVGHRTSLGAVFTPEAARHLPQEKRSDVLGALLTITERSKVCALNKWPPRDQHRYEALEGTPTWAGRSRALSPITSTLIRPLKGL